jgi:antitoxin CptB
MALIAASFIFSGVSKSGSPALKAIIFLPLRLSSFANVEIDIVGEGFTRDRVFEINAIISSFIWLTTVLLVYWVEFIISSSKGLFMSEERWIKIKRLLMQSNRRGIKENDIILGRFAQTHINGLSDEELSAYEELLLENDQELYLWFSRVKRPPNHFKLIVKRICETLV